MITGAELTTLGTGAVTIATVLYGGYKFIAKHFPTATKDAEKVITKEVPHGILAALEDGAKLVDNLAKSPFFAGIAAKGKLQADHVLNKLQDTTGVSEAKTVLLELGKAYEGLSEGEKAKAGVVLKMALSKLGINATDAQVQAWFEDADKAVTALQGDAWYQTAFGVKETPQTDNTATA